MSDSGIGDLSKIVSLIMQNPKLIEEISSLAKSNNVNSDLQESNISSENGTKTVAAEPQDAPENIPAAAMPSRSNSAARAQLLGALKPFVSSQRSGAIDSMLSIADILDMMRSR